MFVGKVRAVFSFVRRVKIAGGKEGGEAEEDPVPDRIFSLWQRTRFGIGVYGIGFTIAGGYESRALSFKTPFA